MRDHAPAPAELWLPPTDRVRSPRTGWTREHWVAVADHLLESLRPWFSRSGARIDLPGRQSGSGRVSDGLEGFARSFLLASFRIAATRGEGCAELIQRYAAGLDAGADPASPEAWPRLTSYSQQLVEASAIAIGLHESRSWLWDRLEPAARERIAGWLGGFVGSRTGDNNWLLFQTVTEQFLASVGAPYRQDEIDRGLDRLEDWHLGDGWYTDGDGRNIDYYNAWVLHSYPIFWARIAAATPGAAYADRLDRYRERLRSYLAQALHLVGNDGGPVHQGRSLCYRFAMLAPFWAGALVDATPLEAGVTRRLCSGVLRHFVERGVPDSRGLLSLGWYDTALGMTQSYSGPGSPYWASQGFLGLLVPADDPVWSESEGRLPLDVDDQVRAMPAPGYLMHGTRADGLVRLLNHGSDHLLGERSAAEPGPAGDPHYDRLAYSSRTGPNLSESTVTDNLVTLVGARGGRSHRGHIHPIAASGRYAASWSVATVPERPGLRLRVETASLVRGSWEFRCCLIEDLEPSEDAADELPEVRFGGYAVADHHPVEDATAPGDRPWALARRTDGLTSVLVGLAGFDAAEVAAAVDGNAFGPRSATPGLIARKPRSGVPLVAAVILSADAVWPEAVADGMRVEVAPNRVELDFPDGARGWLRLGRDVSGPRWWFRSPGGVEDEGGGVVEDGGGQAGWK